MAARVLHVRLFGVPRLFIGTRAIGTSAPPGTLPLLGYLLLNASDGVPRRVAAEALWPDAPSSHSRANLRRHLHYLDRMLEPATRDGLSPIGRDASTLWLEEAAIGSIDVREFESASRSTSADALAAAARLYCGDLLAAYEDAWILTERERLRALFVDTIARTVARYERDGDFRSALRFAETYARTEPYAEDPIRAVMRLRRDLGDAAGSLRAYEAFASLLRDELDAAPSRSLREYAGEIESHPENFRAERTLPLELTSFVGRESETDGVSAACRRERLVTIVGPPGVGKTRLSTRVARRLAGDVPDGAWFVDLTRVPPGASVDRAVAEVVAFDRRSLDADVPLDELVRDKRLLLVLDNCEHVVAACAQTAEQLLKSSPGIRILATSRSPLHVDGEVVRRLEPLPTAASVDLFIDRAASACGVPARDLGIERDDVAALCRTLDGLPLAIELAASRLRSMSLGDLNRQMHARFGVLRREQPVADDLHRTLLATFDWSYALLDERTRELFEQLAIFEGGWTTAAAAALVGEIEGDVLDGLTRLVDQSLVIAPQPGAAQPRYVMLQSTREFALEKLRRRGRERDVRARHAQVLASAFVRRFDDPFSEDLGRSDRAIERELDNLRAALRHLLDEGGDETLGVALVRSLGFFWTEQSPRDEAARWIEDALEKAAGGNENLLSLDVFMSRLLLRSGQPDAALRHADDAVGRSRALGGGAALARALIARARAYWIASDLDRSADDAREALAICSRDGNMFGRGRALSALYLAEISAGRVAEAERAATEATGIYRALRADVEMAESLGNQGTCAYYLQDFERAYALYREAVDTLRGIPSSRTAAFVTHGLASLAWKRGEYDFAWRLLIEALGAAMELGYAPVAVRCLEFVARWSVSTGSYYEGAVFSAASIAASERFNVPFQPVELDDHRAVMRAIESGLDSQRRLLAQIEGANLSLEHAAARAVALASERVGELAR
jgi:predicted ATPase/DNA-binding SARP family transcriptional activator